jgi:phytoene dehydrogenase-like protein
MALYAALALVLPHRGTAVLKGGMGALAAALAARFAELGGKLLEGEEAVRAERHAVTLASGRRLATDAVILNTTPWDARRIVGRLPARHERRLAGQPDAWGALCLYLALPAATLPPDGRFLQLESPGGSVLGDRQSVFVSVGGAERDTPDGLRPATVSVHAHRGAWPGRGPAYDERKAASEAAVLELLRPHLPAPARTITATPSTWVDFAGRAGGRVGGFPAVAGAPPPLPIPPRIAPGVWLVGDSVIPGQSTMAVALAGRTVALAVAAGR